MVLGIWAGTLPLGFLAKRYGRRTAYAKLCRLRRVGRPDRLSGDHARELRLYLMATFFGGLYAASHMSCRFGAADTASKDFKPRRSHG